MFVGTGSDVGKSVLTTAFCRMFLQDGYAPAPFKAQNMASNSFSTEDQLELGRAQAIQAEACSIAPLAEMNPVLLKPCGEQTSQVVVCGRNTGFTSARQFFEESDRTELFSQVMGAYSRLANQYNPMVIEGAGSISEINLWDRDIVNMKMAEEVQAATYLIADIDRGGVFASVYGSIMLLPEEQRKLIKGIIINKFRGDESLFVEGRKKLEELTGVPVVGVLPYLHGVYIEPEDSLSLSTKKGFPASGAINIAIVKWPHVSHFTDFHAMERTDGLHVYYTNDAYSLSVADIIILPHTDKIIEDLQLLRAQGLDEVIQEAVKKNKTIVGVDAGYQAMGKMITSFDGTLTIEGLDILPINSQQYELPKPSSDTFYSSVLDTHLKGYLVASGVSNLISEEKAEHTYFAQTLEGLQDGYVRSPKIWGTYLHGIWNSSELIQYLGQQVDPAFRIPEDYKSKQEKGFNQLADWIRSHVDTDYIYRSIEL